MQEDSLRVKEARFLPNVLIDVGAAPKLLWDGASASRDSSTVTAQIP